MKYILIENKMIDQTALVSNLILNLSNYGKMKCLASCSADRRCSMTIIFNKNSCFLLNETAKYNLKDVSNNNNQLIYLKTGFILIYLILKYLSKLNL